MKKFAIIYSQKAPIALEILSEILLDYTLEYPVCFKKGDALPDADFIKIHIGTQKDYSDFSCPECDEGYLIKVENQQVYIIGSDDAGLVYGCLDFYSKYLLKLEYPHNPDKYVLNPFDRPLPDFEFASSPSIKNRGIWTWGHVIYDWRKFIDNMLKLKLNTLIIWNDFVPANAKELIDYAHRHFIKVIFGFSWCWDTNCAAFDLETIKGTSQGVFENFEKNYSHLKLDGIYFQSFTELKTETIGGVLIAQAVADYVNHTANLFFEKYPDLELQFGLHAISVKDRLDYIKRVNPKIKIVWEDCGAFPFSYLPSDIKDFDSTADFVRKIAVLRENERFGAVTKGFTKLDWGAFSHPLGASHIGVSSKFVRENRIIRKQKIWKYLQAYWLTNADKAREMVKIMCDIKGGNLDISALVEDGMFEENIMFPVALYSEFLWDCECDCDKTVNEVALKSFVTFA